MTILAPIFLIALRPVNQQTTTKFSFVGQAARVEKFLADLSKVAGVNLSAGAAMNDEIICARMKDVTLDETLAKIADAMDASWRKDETGYRLVRTSEGAANQRSREQAYLVEAIVKAQKKMADELTKLAPWNDKEADTLAKDAATFSKNAAARQSDPNFWRQREALDSRGPASRALKEAIIAMNPAELASVKSGMRVVWSTSPNRREYPFSSKVIRIFEGLANAQQIWKRASEKAGLNAKARQEESMIYLGGIFGDPQNGETKVGNITKVLVVASQPGFGSPTNFEMLAADAKGHVVIRANSGLNLDLNEIWSNRDSLAPKPGEKKIQPDGDLLEIGKVMNSMQSGKMTPLPAPLRAKLLQPEIDEPLQFFGSPSIVQYAELRNLNMVCQAPDTLVTAIMAAMTPMSVDAFAKVLQGPMGMNLVESPGWVVMKPNAPVQAKETRVGRKILGRYVRAQSKGTRFSLDERAYYALNMPRQRENYLVMFLSLFANNNPDMNMRDDTETLRFYGLMDPAQRRQMTLNPVPASSLTSTQLAELNHMVYDGQNNNMQFTPDQSGGNFDADSWNLFYNGIYREAAESLPDGIPPNATIKMDVVSDTVIAAKYDGPSAMYMSNNAMEAQSVAWTMFMQTRPELFPNMKSGGTASFDRVKVSQRQKITFQFKFTPLLSMTKMLEDSDFVNAKEVPWSEVPKEFRDEVSKIMEDYKKSYAGAKPGQFSAPTFPGAGRTVPPPR